MLALSQIVGKRLTYKQVTGKEGGGVFLALTAGTVAGSLRLRTAFRLPCIRQLFFRQHLTYFRLRHTNQDAHCVLEIRVLS